ncbi:uncharacterized protein LOC113302675 [Papaver somniferum]|uniref:uncharacterized protein LOC113302675 n=1 Tax=Papaver somniferum TaxID=3469 RepID=UPI000E6FEE37|nr:uncharacterized protein LOC113302675 [Papaver somniferum]
MFIRYTSAAHQPPCKVKIASTDSKKFSKMELIPSYFFDEDDDSLELELIPQFFFAEEEDDDSSNFELLINLSDKVNFKSKEVISSEVNCEKIDCSKELIISHSKLFRKNCFTPLFDDSRSIFDRGKYVVVPPNCIGKLILSLGFKSGFGFLDLIIPLCVHDADICVDGKLLVKRPEGVTWNLGNDRDDFLLQLQRGSVLLEYSFMDHS